MESKFCLMKSIYKNVCSEIIIVNDNNKETKVRRIIIRLTIAQL